MTSSRLRLSTGSSKVVRGHTLRAAQGNGAEVEYSRVAEQLKSSMLMMLSRLWLVGDDGFEDSTGAATMS